MKSPADSCQIIRPNGAATLLKLIRCCVPRHRFLAAAVVLLLAHAPQAMAQYGGRVATVEVAEAKEEVVTATTAVQGRVATGPAIAITATINAKTEMLDLRIGDMVRAGQRIAIQDATSHERRLATLNLQLDDARNNVAEIQSDMQSDLVLLEINSQQFGLLEAKAKRARELASRNALSADAVDTAENAMLQARFQLAARKAAMAKKSYQLKKAETLIERLRGEIADVKTDIADTVITAPTAGQLVFVAPVSRGYNRQGDVIARILDLGGTEVEAEIPTIYLQQIQAAPIIMGEGLAGEKLVLMPRALLPVQNARTGTRTMRFEIKNKIAESMNANNAVVTLQVPTSSPEPAVTIVKDAVLPVQGGHVVYLAKDGVAVRQRIKLGAAFGDSFVVTTGLTAGDQVIVRGNEALTDGKKIKLAGAAGAQPAAGKKPEGDAWTLNWTTRRGPASGDLFLGKDKSTFNDEEVTVTRAGDSINFIGKLDLPFGILDLEFTGKIDGDSMAGDLQMRGLPGGREANMEFTGTKAK